MRVLKRLAIVASLMQAGPVLACEICDSKLVLLPRHADCFKARISDFVSEAEEIDPYLVNFESCNTDGPFPDGFDPKGTSIDRLLPQVGDQPKVRPSSPLPKGYKTFAFLTFYQLNCLSGKLDQLTDRPVSMTTFTFADC